MKKVLIFITLAIILHTGLHSQTYVPFPTANASWNVYREYEMLGDPKNTFVDKYTLSGADTTINSIKYKILLDNSYFIGGIREQDKKIYYSPSYGGEYLLYDFNAQVGDTIRHSSTLSYMYTVVKAIDSIQIDGNYRKRYIVSVYGYEPDSIIEGIGSVKNSLIYAVQLISTCTCVNYWEHICFEENGVVKYLNPDFSDCSSTKPIAGINETYSDAEIKIYPNPAQHTVYIKSNKAQAISIFNSSGQLMEKATLPAQSEYMLNIDNYSKGTYFISVTGGTKGAVQFIKE
ncbi:MAG: T9SS type A sorting domain-containing protein [Paludibacteraceae bacterium]|nr:T9SS type A sorting domain-containing protein [Paludibacteraceae bacterium]